MERLNLLACTVAGTLLGDDRALDAFASWYGQANCQFRVAYISDEFVEVIRASMRASNLPQPDAIIGGNGTEIYDIAVSRRVPMWPPSPLGWNPHVVQTICESHCELALRPKHFLSYHRVSYFSENLTQSLVDDLWKQMASAGLQVTITRSSERHLDIVPMGVDKGSAVAHLAYRWKIDPKRVVVAGVSDNDLALYQARFRGIVVSNAHPDLRALVMSHIYQATKGCAAGVLEGVDYWLQAPHSPSAM